MNKKVKKGLLVLSILSVSTLGIGATTVSALGNRSKAEKLSELTGKSVDEIVDEKYNSDKTYGEIAAENGVLDDFIAYNHETKVEHVQEKIDNGVITEEKGAQILEQMAEHQANCDGTGNQSHVNQNHDYYDHAQEYTHHYQYNQSTDDCPNYDQNHNYYQNNQQSHSSSHSHHGHNH